MAEVTPDSGAEQIARPPAPSGKRPKLQCPFEKAGVEYIDYKDVDTLKRYLNDQGKILPRRITGISARFQRQYTTAVKRARIVALLPFIADNVK